jgi:ubiquinone/menaquinone biosynthesis C-methylase UbiE
MVNPNDAYTQMTEAEARACYKNSTQQPVYQRIANELRPDETILDVACGNGVGALWYPLKGYLGVDISAPCIRVAQEEHPGYSFLTVPPGCLAFADKSFDVTVCKSTLEHLPTIDDSLLLFKEVVRVARRLAMIAWHTPPQVGMDADVIQCTQTKMLSRPVYQNYFRLEPYLDAVDDAIDVVTCGPHTLWLIAKVHP